MGEGRTSTSTCLCLVPPHMATMTPSKMQSSPPPSEVNALHNSSLRHPVFFTTKLRKPPLFAARVPVTAHLSPVAQGYVYHDSERRPEQPKL